VVGGCRGHVLGGCRGLVVGGCRGHVVGGCRGHVVGGCRGHVVGGSDTEFFIFLPRAKISNLPASAIFLLIHPLFSMIFYVIKA
jgi:hypothetical protein